MAETALWATLALHRGYFDYARSQQQGLWQPRPQRRADSVHVLVLGLGQMGLTSARRIAQQGYRVSGWSQRARAPSADLDGIAVHAGEAALPVLLAASDIVINLLPLTPATRGLLDARFFAALPPGAGIVNLARGAHVVDADLLAALDRGHLAHAVLDVFHTEPLPAGHAVLVTPARGGAAARGGADRPGQRQPGGSGQRGRAVGRAAAGPSGGWQARLLSRTDSLSKSWRQRGA